MRGALAIAAWLAAMPAGAQALSHRLDSLSVDGERVSEARLVQGELRVHSARGWLRRR